MKTIILWLSVFATDNSTRDSQQLWIPTNERFMVIEECNGQIQLYKKRMPHAVFGCASWDNPPESK